MNKKPNVPGNGVRTGVKQRVGLSKREPVELL